MVEKWMKKIKRNDEENLLEQHFPGNGCGKNECEQVYLQACQIAKKINVSPHQLVAFAIEHEIAPIYGCKHVKNFADYPNSENYPNKGKSIPKCRFGYTYGSHPDKSDAQLEAKKQNKGSCIKSIWEKIKEPVNNVKEATKTVIEQKYAPPAISEFVGGVQAGTKIITSLNIQVAHAKTLVREVEKATGENLYETNMQINDCLSNQDFKKLMTIKSKLQKRLNEIEKSQK